MKEKIRRPKRWRMGGIGRLIKEKAFPAIGYIEFYSRNKRIKCCRGICKRTTKSPKTDKWIYFEKAPQKVPHWERKYMCRPCWDILKAVLEANGTQRMPEH
jgi:hypothetical protein